MLDPEKGEHLLSRDDRPATESVDRTTGRPADRSAGRPDSGGPLQERLKS